MSIKEIPNDKNFAPMPDNSEGLRAQVFNPSERTALTMGDTNPALLLEKNEALVAAIHEQATRVASAACKTLQGLPAHLQASFMDGISCYNSGEDVVYNALRTQWNSSDTNFSTNKMP